MVRDFTPFGKELLTFLNKAVNTPFICSAKFLVNMVNQTVGDNGQNQGIQNLRYDDSSQVKKEIDSSPHQEGKAVLADSVKQIRHTDQKQRGFDIVIIKNTVKISGKISDPHVEQSLVADDCLKKQVAAQAAEKTGEQSASAPPHQSERNRHDQQQIGLDRCNLQKLEQAALQNAGNDNHCPHNQFSSHGHSPFWLLITGVPMTFLSAFPAKD